MWFVTICSHNCIVAGESQGSSNKNTVIRLDPPYLKTEMQELTCGSYSNAYFKHIAMFKVLYH